MGMDDNMLMCIRALAENGSVKLFELPPNLKGLISMQDVSDFNENRYFLGKQQKELFEKIVEKLEAKA